jgi:4-methyl-5(b-hydroxyethyl)-thiazole monophosphate biosynthesis
MAKVYIFLADGFEEVEGLTVVDLLRRAGIDIKMVSVTGERNVKGSNQITAIADILFEEADFSEADLLVLPGGMPGTLNLMKHKGLDKLLKEFNAEDRGLAAICAAPTIFGSKGFLKGKKAVCYSGMEEQLTDAVVTDSPVVVDGNITTSKGIGTAIEFALSIVKGFQGESAAEKLAKGIQYQNYKV